MAVPESVKIAEDFINGTLIIVPSPLLQVWSTQLSQHLSTDSIKWTKYHGVQRFRSLDEMRHFDIILTTFQTIASEQTHGKHKSSPIFAAHWHRIILDEGRNQTLLSQLVAYGWQPIAFEIALL
ncbi:SNF2-related protein [Neofusicoccum parvum]|uniref:SNF2-related protein n=1 Tax=Neofusicoccum parvum TaxID=310453 RepID=A0ACB5S3A8_9PEZI|nr:SNF2-related protein [Neofusicoccum parvum]